MKTNASIKQVVLENLKKELIYKLERIIEQVAADEKYQSTELSESYFHLEAIQVFNQALLSNVMENSKQAIHNSKVND